MRHHASFARAAQLTALFLAIALLSGCRPLGSAKPPALKGIQRDLHQVLHRLDGDGASFAGRVIDIDTGAEIYSESADSAMLPASNGKLAISAAAVDMFGAEYTFKTYLVRDGDDIWIVGTGDPGCGDEKVAQWRGRSRLAILDNFAAALQRRGIGTIRGNLIYFDGAFDRELTCPTWNKDFLVDWYGAPVSGLNFNDNCIDVTASPGENGQPARLEVFPAGSIAKVKNETVTGGEGELVIERAPDAPEFTVKGGVGVEKKLESKPITDPGLFFADAFRTHLSARGIEVKGEIRRGEKLPWGVTGPIFERLLATHETSMVDVLNRVNKDSQNLFAEALSKALGREWMYRRGESVPGSWKLGEEATKAFLWKHNIDAGQYVAADGSGLARENRITARMITELLKVMTRHPAGQAWQDSLAVSGVDGTIDTRLQDMPGLVHAKTGYIGGVRTLSGYITSKNGRRLAFSFLYNKIPGSVEPYEALQDDACRVLRYWPSKPPKVPAAAVEEEPPTTVPAVPTTEPATAPAN